MKTIAYLIGREEKTDTDDNNTRLNMADSTTDAKKGFLETKGCRGHRNQNMPHSRHCTSSGFQQGLVPMKGNPFMPRGVNFTHRQSIPLMHKKNNTVGQTH